MGVVYKAEDTKLKRIVALKFLPADLTRDKQARQRFVHEAQAASAFEHQNICNIHEINETEDGQTYLVMAHYEGETLKEKITRGPLKVEEAVDYAVQIAHGLHKAHEKGIIHRDIKPANIMVTSDGVVKILDFGLAKLLGKTKLTKTGSTLGTVHYMSPEQTRGKNVDHRTDIWSLGAVLYEMVTGEPPFKGDYEQAVIYSILNEEPQSIRELRPDLPEELDKIVGRCLEKNPEQRYQGLEKITVHLNLMIQGSPIHIPLNQAGKKRQILLFTCLLSLFFILAGTTLIILINKKYGLPWPKARFGNEKIIAVMPFENHPDPENKNSQSRMITSLLSLALTESRYIHVVSDQGLMDILKRMGQSNLRLTDRSIHMELARNARAEQFVQGEIFNTDSAMIVACTIVDVKTGENVKAERIEGNEIISIADQLSIKIKQDLVLPRNAYAETMKSLRDLTTNSKEALKYFVQGQTCSQKMLFHEAAAHFKKAIQIDTTFAWAYLELFQVPGSITPDLMDYLNKAVRYSEKTPEYVRLLILIQYELFYQNPKKALALCRELIRKYPEFEEGYSYMAQLLHFTFNTKKSLPYYKKYCETSNNCIRSLSYQQIALIQSGHLDYARACVQKMVELYPNESITANRQITQLIAENKLKDAVNEIQNALKIYKNDYLFTLLLGEAYLFSGKLDSALLAFEKISSHTYQDRITLGIISGANKHIFKWLADSMQSRDLEICQNASQMKRRFYDLLGDKKGALEIWLASKDYYEAWLKEQKAILSDDPTEINRSIYITIPDSYYQEATDNALALCDEAGRKIRIKKIGRGDQIQVKILRADILLSAGRFKEAKKVYNDLIDELPGVSYFQYRLAECYFHQKKWSSAKDVLRGINNIENYFLHRSSLLFPENGLVSYAFAYPRIIYLLAKVNEELKEENEAIQAYEQLLTIWKNADSDLPELIDAKTRLAKLTSSK